MCQIEEFSTPGLCIPDRLRDVDHDVAAIVPRGEDADLRLSPGPDRAIEEADSWVTAARIRQDEQPINVSSFRLNVPIEAQSRQGGLGLIRRQSRRGADFLQSIPMENRHVFQPVAQFVLVVRSSKIVGGSRRGN